MSTKGSQGEKRRYWQSRLTEIAAPVPIDKFLKMNWAIEEFRTDNVASALKYLKIPGSPEDHKIGERFFIPPWDLDGLLNERLLLGKEPIKSKRVLDLTAWRGVAKILNTYKGLANIESTKDIEGDGIIAAMPRLFWPQYEWQIGYTNAFRVARAWHTYASSEGRKAFKNKHEIDLDVFLKIAFAIFAITSERPAINSGSLTELGATNVEIRATSRVIGMSVDQHCENARLIRNLQIPIENRRSSSKEFPIFTYQGVGSSIYVVPSRELLLLRITDGLYYDIVYDDNARRSSGEQFEILCHDILQHYLGDAVNISGERTTSYGMSADFILIEPETTKTLFVECKARRIPNRVLTSADPWNEFHKDFEDIIKGVYQIWRSQAELFPNNVENRAGVVLCYDPWTIMGGEFRDELLIRAHLEADKLNIPPEHRIPVALIGFADFETCIRKFEFSDVVTSIPTSEGMKHIGYNLLFTLEEVAKVTQETAHFDYSKVIKTAVPWWSEN